MCRNMSGMEMTAPSFMTIMSAFYFILQLVALLLLVKLCILSTDEGGKRCGWSEQLYWTWEIRETGTVRLITPSWEGLNVWISVLFSLVSIRPSTSSQRVFCRFLIHDSNQVFEIRKERCYRKWEDILCQPEFAFIFGTVGVLWTIMKVQ